MSGVLGAQNAHHDEVFPAVGVEFGFPADPFLAEAAGQVAVDGTAVAGQRLQLDAVHIQHIKRPGQHQSGNWTTPGILEAVKPGRMQGHGGTAEVSGGAA